MTTFNLRTLKLRSGEQFRDEQEIKLEPLELGGQRYLPVPETVPAELTITRASTGTVFEHAFHVRLHGPRRLRRPVPGLRQEPERRAARSRRARAGLALGCAGGA